VDEPAHQVVPLLEGYRSLLDSDINWRDLWHDLEDVPDANGTPQGVSKGQIPAQPKMCSVPLNMIPVGKKCFRMVGKPWSHVHVLLCAGSLRPGSERRRDRSEMKPTAAQMDPKWASKRTKA
jgi:hypothetical protein